MPVFSWTSDELTSLRLWEEELGRKAKLPERDKPNSVQSKSLIAQGERLVESYRCASCHLVSRTSGRLTAAALPSLSDRSRWDRSCAGEPSQERKQPGYRLVAADASALEAYYTASRPGEEKLAPQARGSDLLLELNCLACHQREGTSVVGSLRVRSNGANGTGTVPATLADKLAAVAAAHEDLAPLVPAMTPPALNSVGDKLHDEALAGSISREGPAHRPYLLVQMPKFKLTKEQLASLTAYFTVTDRIPSRGASITPGQTSVTQATASPPLLAAGPRLVTTDGMCCTSCHADGTVQPAKAPLNARGPDISMVGKRIRREWFDRWCADPARIVPRMEMPSV
jgi:hypothetical protein